MRRSSQLSSYALNPMTCVYVRVRQRDISVCLGAILSSKIIKKKTQNMRKKVAQKQHEKDNHLQYEVQTRR